MRLFGRSVSAEDAAVRDAMLEFRATDSGESVSGAVNLHGGEHSENRSSEINPALRPDTAWHCGRKRACGIYAHAGEWRLEGDVERDQDSREESRVTRKLRCVGGVKDH